MDRSNRELVFCHECENEWYRDEHGIICPQCTSEFTEVVSLSSVENGFVSLAIWTTMESVKVLEHYLEESQSPIYARLMVI